MAVTAAQYRKLALALPEAEERETWGEPTFRVRDKIFSVLAPDGRTASVKCSLEEQAELVASAPEVFQPSAYTGRFGWVTMQLGGVSADEARELLTDAWRRTAPKRLAAEHKL